MIGLSIVGAFSAAVSAVSSFAASAGGMISAAAAKIMPMVTMVIDKGIPIFKKALEIMTNLMHLLSVLKPEEELEDVGDRAMQAERSEQNIVPDKYEKYDDYLDAIRKFDVDPEKSKENKESGAAIAGLIVAGKAMEVKFDLDDGAAGDIFRIIAISQELFDSKRLGEMVRTETNFGNIANYFDGKLSPTQAREVRESLLNIEKALNPEADEERFYEKVSAAKDKEEQGGT